MNEKYLEHLLYSISKHMYTIKRQMGKTDIEPYNNEDQVTEWYETLIEKVKEKKPENYVKSLCIYEKGVLSIEHINYVYFTEEEKIKTTAINLFDANENHANAD